MIKLSLADTLDILFYSVSAWALTFGILRYYRVQTGVGIAVSVLIALAVLLAVGLVLWNSRRKKLLTKREREEREALLLHLTLEKEERVRAALLAAYLADGKEAHCEDDCLKIGQMIIVPLFTMQPLSADEIARTLRRHGGEELLVVCNMVTPEAEKLLRTFGKKYMGGDEVYRLFSRTETTPSPLICGALPRRSVRTKLRRTFSKKNARPFFVSGLLLLFMSLFTLFRLYYLISGAVLLISAVLVRALGAREGV